MRPSLSGLPSAQGSRVHPLSKGRGVRRVTHAHAMPGRTRGNRASPEIVVLVVSVWHFLKPFDALKA